MSKHTPGPWVNDRGTVVTQPNGDLVQEIAECHLDGRGSRSAFYIGAAEKDRNAARIIACVNACEGIADPAVALDSIRQALRNWQTGQPTTRAAQELALVCAAYLGDPTKGRKARQEADEKLEA